MRWLDEPLLEFAAAKSGFKAFSSRSTG